MLGVGSRVRLAQGAVSAGALQADQSGGEVRSGHLVFKKRPQSAPGRG